MNDTSYSLDIDNYYSAKVSVHYSVLGKHSIGTFMISQQFYV